MQRYENADQYLAQSVLNASPARLRLMLIERGQQLAESLAATPKDAVDPSAFAEWTLHLREILGELLSGVSIGETDVARKVSDLYVFLLQHLSLAEAHHDPMKWATIAEVLGIERETWQAVCQQQVPRPSLTPAPHALPLGTASPPLTSLNLEA